MIAITLYNLSELKRKTQELGLVRMSCVTARYERDDLVMIYRPTLADYI